MSTKSSIASCGQCGMLRPLAVMVSDAMPVSTRPMMISGTGRSLRNRNTIMPHIAYATRMSPTQST